MRVETGRRFDAGQSVLAIGGTVFANASPVAFHETEERFSKDTSRLIGTEDVVEVGGGLMSAALAVALFYAWYAREYGREV